MYALRMMGGCNNDCIHCMVSEELARGKCLSLEELKRMIYSKRNDKIDFFGGEPAIQPHFLEALRYAKSLGIKCWLGTNARVFYYKEFAKRIAETGIDMVRSSVYGHDAKLHDSITTVPGSFNQTIGGIKNILKYKIPLIVNVVIMKPNYRHLEEITKLLIGLGVSDIKYSSLILRGNAYKNRKSLAVEISKVKPYLQKALKNAAECNIKIRIEKNPICIAPEFAEHFIKESDPRVDPNEMFSKSEKCKKCKYNSRCVGISKRYEGLFGLSELTPQ